MREKALEAKKAIVEEIKENIEKSQAIVLVDYLGLDVDETSELRSKYREAGAEYKVYKNTMMRFAFKDAGYDEFLEYLTGPNAVAFGFEDPVSVAKVTNDFAKDNDKLEIKVGIVDGEIVNVEKVKQLASLSSREELVAQVLRGINSPLQGLANVLNGNIRGLAQVLGAIRDKKQAEA